MQLAILLLTVQALVLATGDPAPEILSQAWPRPELMKDQFLNKDAQEPGLMKDQFLKSGTDNFGDKEKLRVFRISVKAWASDLD